MATYLYIHIIHITPCFCYIKHFDHRTSHMASMGVHLWVVILTYHFNSRLFSVKVFWHRSTLFSLFGCRDSLLLCQGLQRHLNVNVNIECLIMCAFLPITSQNDSLYTVLCWFQLQYLRYGVWTLRLHCNRIWPTFIVMLVHTRIILHFKHIQYFEFGSVM